MKEIIRGPAEVVVVGQRVTDAGEHYDVLIRYAEDGLGTPAEIMLDGDRATVRFPEALAFDATKEFISGLRRVTAIEYHF